MREINVAELKNIETNILISIDIICRKESIRYSLAYGTLLGAVRHKGFIPWDDDIDIIMPRPDYERFIEYCKSNSDIPFDLLTYKTSTWYEYPFAKACAKNTIIEEDTDFDKLMGIYIDIFPIDGIGNSYKEAKRNFLTTEIKRDLMFASHWKHFFRSKTHKWYYEPVRFLFFVASRFVNGLQIIKSCEKKYIRYGFDASSFVANIYSPYRLKDIMSRHIYDGYIEMEFEGHMFNAIRQYDEFLKTIYGDYMKLPAPEERVSHHLFKAYYKD